MAYRFTDTNKWADGWFIELRPNEKLMFDYLTDNCDIAGFYELSMRKLRDALHPLTDDEIKSALKAIEKSYVLSRDKSVLFLKNFCKHQKNVPLREGNKAHKGIFYRLDNYKDRFAHDLVKIINNSYKPSEVKGASIPLKRGTGNGIGTIDFINFWSLYDKKIGNKHACEKKWNNLKTSIQEKIIKILPEWKKQFTAKIFQPYPETFLNGERWNDEIEEKNLGVKSPFPDYWSSDFASKLDGAKTSAYWKHLRELNFVPKKNSLGMVTDWVKAS